ncbi:UDP-2-acetamido-3-amino-2,3-dideoxy-glucuronate N-acetyltransferase [Methylococcales bacterium]|nr:UDP-2-acetamido-3-amino-2,3-dideoxy-glucuronate N-acetyltransferase [Methylococcales bacterium]
MDDALHFLWIINMTHDTHIHETAIIDPGANIGTGCHIWHWTHVCSGAVIGNHCSLGQNVFIANSARLGNGVKVQNHVSIFDGVNLEDDVFCGPGMTFTNVYNPRAAISRKHEYRPTLVKKGATLGANCTIVCGVTIGEYSFIGAGAVVNRNVKPYALMVGVPAKQIGWVSEYGEKLGLPLTGKGVTTCSSTGKTYILEADLVKKRS